MNRPYNVGLLDDLHTYYPAILYDPSSFTSISSILQYVQTQNRYHFDIFSRNERAHNAHQQAPMTPPPRISSRSPPPIQQRHSSDIPPRLQQQPPDTESFDLTQFFTNPLDDHLFYPLTPAQQLRNSIYPTSLLREILNMIQPSQRTATGAVLESVVVRPSIEDIEAATSLRAATESDEEEIQACSICQEGYTEGQAIRTINHCHHAFHKTCIDPWFQRNVRCPVCRYDIREPGTQPASLPS